MLAYLTLTAAIAFWVGIKVAKQLFVALNKHYSVSFYVPRVAVKFSDIGDFETIAVANLKTEEPQSETVILTAYGAQNITLELDTVSHHADIAKTRLCIYDFALLLPVATSHDEVSGRSKARYKLPRALQPGQTINVWFFN